jgi:hypothetical protein
MLAGIEARFPLSDVERYGLAGAHRQNVAYPSSAGVANLLRREAIETSMSPALPEDQVVHDPTDQYSTLFRTRMEPPPLPARSPALEVLPSAPRPRSGHGRPAASGYLISPTHPPVSSAG